MCNQQAMLLLRADRRLAGRHVANSTTSDSTLSDEIQKAFVSRTCAAGDDKLLLLSPARDAGVLSV